MNDLLDGTAVALAAALRRREVSVTEVTAACLGRAAVADPVIGAFTDLRPARALATAARLDRAPDEARRGPLWGVPTAMKDLHLVAGFRAQMGSRAFRWGWSPVDDLTTRAIKRGGMVILGKTSTSELAILPFVETAIGPPTRSPRDPERLAGGSSGGSAAAVAGGVVPIAPGSDGGGSIRIPAAFCGLVGHKPTRGLVPNPMGALERTGVSVIGPLARSVDDAAALLEVLTGVDLAAAVRRPPQALTVHFAIQTPLAPVAPEAAEGVRRALAVLEALGHHVAEGPPLTGEVEEFMPIYRHLAARIPVLFPSRLEGTTRWLREAGRDVTLAQALAARDALGAKVDGWLAPVDVWVTPTVVSPPPRVGAFDGLDGGERFHAAATLGLLTAALNASGHPAVSVPVPGQLVGVQLIGHRGDDARLLALARALMVGLWGEDRVTSIGVRSASHGEG